MAEYHTKVVTLDDITVTVSKAKSPSAGDRIEAVLKWIAEQIDSLPRPDQGLPGEQPGIDNSLPGSQPRPDQGLPGSQPGIDNSLPGQGGRPDNTLPGSQPGPDNTLPGGQGGRPDNSLPGDQPRPDQGLPGAQPGVDNELPHEALVELLEEKAKDIALAILKDTACDPAQPKGGKK